MPDTRYEKLVFEEDSLIKKLYTCEEAAAALCHWVYKNADMLDVLLIEEGIKYYNNLHHDLHTELMLLRLEKARISYIMADQ